MGFDYSKTRLEVQKILLDDLLNQLEVDISRIGQGKLDNARNLLVKMDEAQQRIEAMVQKGIQVKAESAQFDYLVYDLEKNAKKALSDLGGSKQLDILRKQRPFGQDSRWWHLDEIVANQRKRTFTKLVIGIISSGLLIVLLTIVYNAFLKPDPAASGKYTHQMNAEQWLAQGDYDKALEEINLALGFAPSDPDLVIMRGVTQTKLGNIELATIDFNTAEKTLGNRLDFALLRSQSWFAVGDYQNSIADSQEIIEEDPTSAEGYYYYGRANELLKNYQAAINAYETASKLAQSQEKAELDATIRISLAMLMQSFPGGLPTLQQTPAH